MRLSEYEINSIRILTREIFGQKTIVKLFGSRLIDSKKGGDIDLFVKPGCNSGKSEMISLMNTRHPF